MVMRLPDTVEEGGHRRRADLLGRVTAAGPARIDAQVRPGVRADGDVRLAGHPFEDVVDRRSRLDPEQRVQRWKAQVGGHDGGAPPGSGEGYRQVGGDGRL